MKKLIKYILIIVIVVLTAGIYVYNKPHMDIKSARPDFILDAQTLFNDFETDEDAANIQYLDKVMLVKGNVREIILQNGGMSVVLDAGNSLFGVNCNINELKNPKFKTGDPVKIKGICTGMLADVALNNCVIVE